MEVTNKVEKIIGSYITGFSLSNDNIDMKFDELGLDSMDVMGIFSDLESDYGITVSDLISNSRKQHLVKARQMAIYLCHELTSLSLAKIGQNFGNRDHSTVLYSCEKLKGLINTNEEIKNDIENITIKITNL